MKNLALYYSSRYEVARTGKLQQFYTLYRIEERGIEGFYNSESCVFIKNLAHDIDSAIIEAKKIAVHSDIEIVESHKEEYQNFNAFNLQWKNGKGCFFAEANSDFWAIWRDNKEILKTIGFWVSKNKNDDFMVFCKLDESKKIENLPTLKTEYPKMKEGKQEIEAELMAVKSSFNDYGPTVRATFKLANGYQINGTLPKKISADSTGKRFIFTATIAPKGHGFGFYQRAHKIKRLTE